MGTFAAGQVILLPFPFSDLTRSKLRPALLLADAGRDDWIACQITSNPYADPHAIALATEDFTSDVCSAQALRAPANYSPPMFPCLLRRQACSLRVGGMKCAMR